jgi:hypothetical protein
MKKLRNSNSIALKFKIEKFLTETLWQILVVFAFVFVCAWLFDKYYEAVMFCIAHTVIRLLFDKQYHCGTTALCMVTTITVAFFGLMYTFPIKISLLSSIPICWFISWVGYIAQDRLDCHLIIKKLQDKNIWQMGENELVDYCYAKGIKGDMLEFVIMIVIYQMKYEDIAIKLKYSVDTLKDWSPICKRKLNITSWKQHQN